MAEAIQNHTAVVARYERVGDARAQLDDRYFGELQPRLRAAMDALNEAKLDAPSHLLDELLGEPQADGPTVAEAQTALHEAQAAVENAQRARAMLLEEAGRAASAVSIATPALAEAVNAVIRAEASVLLPHFVECRRRFAEAASALLSLPSTIIPSEVANSQRVGDVVVTVAAYAGTGRAPDPAIAMWLADLRKDPDARLPDLPPPEPPDAGNHGAPVAA